METIRTWPEYIDRAFRAFYYGGQYEKAIEAFAQRWGGFDAQSITRVLSEGTREEKALALFALGYSDVPGAREILLLYLQSTEPMERWVSALCLGEMKEERALPALFHMLDEFLPPRVHPLEREGGLYHFWRIKIAHLFGEWGRSDLAPVLRHGLEKSWNIEQAEQPDHKQVWHAYQDELVYALGRLGAFGALAGFSFPEPRFRLWMVTLSCGSLQARHRYGDLLTQLQINEELKAEVAQVLEQRFGLSAPERAECIDRYADVYFARMEWK